MVCREMLIWYVVECYAVLCHIVKGFEVECQAGLKLCRGMRYCGMVCRAMLCRSMVWYAMKVYAVQCHVVTCCAVEHHAAIYVVTYRAMISHLTPWSVVPYYSSNSETK